MKIFVFKSFFLLLVVGACIPQNGYAQLEELGKWQVKTGISPYYINSLPDFDHATDFSTEIAYRMNTGFDVGIGYSMAWVKRIYGSYGGPDGEEQFAGDFDGLEGQEIHHAIRLLVGRHFLLGDNRRHVVGLGTGALILGEEQIDYKVIPTAILELPDGEQFYQYKVHQYKQDRLFHIAGFLFNTEYSFRLNNHLGIGFRVEGLFLFDYGFDRYSFGPKISAFF